MSQHVNDGRSRSMAEYSAMITQCVNAFGSKREPKLPIPNDPSAAAAQEYAIAKLIADAAEERKDIARRVLMSTLTIPPVKGKHIVHDSLYAFAEVQNVAAPRRLSESLLLKLLAKEGMDMDKAAGIIEAAKPVTNDYISRLTVLLKQ